MIDADVCPASALTPSSAFPVTHALMKSNLAAFSSRPLWESEMRRMLAAGLSQRQGRGGWQASEALLTAGSQQVAHELCPDSDVPSSRCHGKGDLLLCGHSLRVKGLDSAGSGHCLLPSGVDWL